jgi:hypothetical protein
LLNAARETRALGLQASSMSGAAQCREAYQLLALGGLSEEEVDGLFSVAQVAIAKPGEAFSKNEAIAKSAYDDKFVLLLSGSANIMRAGEIERTLVPGDFVGEQEFLQLGTTKKK